MFTYMYIASSVQCLCLETCFAGRGGWPWQPERIDLNVAYMMFSFVFSILCTGTLMFSQSGARATSYGTGFGQSAVKDLRSTVSQAARCPDIPTCYGRGGPAKVCCGH